MNITVIGAGLAGLTAAYRLRQSDFRVNVLEAETCPGGRMAEKFESGLCFHTGARLVYSFSRSVLRLVDELGISNELRSELGVPVTARTQGGEYPIRMAPGPELMFNPLLKFDERMRVFCLVINLLSRRKKSDPDQLLAWQSTDSETLTEFFRRKGLDEFAALFVEPVFRGARGWRLKDVSPAFFLGTAAYMYRSKAYGFSHGIGTLTKNLAKRLDVTYGARVENIIRLSDRRGCQIQFQQDGTTVSSIADVVVCATPGSVLAKIVSSPTLEEVEFFNAIQYSSGGIVHFGMKKRLQPSICFLGAQASRSVSAIEITSQDHDDCKYPTRISLHLSPEQIDIIKRQTDRNSLLPSIWSDAPEDVKRQLEADGQTQVEQWIEHMLPVFYPGYLEKLRTFADRQVQRKRRIYYAGDYMAHALVGGACRSGQDVAKIIASHWSD